jgi:ATP-binding cassette subfamily C protein
MIGYLEQDPVLLEDTIGYNIFAEHTKENNLDEYDSIISEFGLRDFIYSLPNGLDTIMSEKTQNISGGEKQKISLLRIIINNPDVLILDEPTSAMDSKSKNTFIEKLRIMRDNKISIIVTHDPDLLNAADEIIVI